MVTRMQVGEAVNGGARRFGRGWGTIGRRPLVAVAITAALLVSLVASVAVSRVDRSDPALAERAQVIQQNPDADANAMANAAVRQPDAVMSRERQQFLEWNLYLPVPDSTSVGPSQHGDQQAQLYEIEVRDTGHGTTGADDGPCRSPGRSCDR